MLKSINTPTQQLEKLLDALSVVKTKVKSGYTLGQALHESEKQASQMLKVERSLAEQWVFLRERIQEGMLPAVNGLECLIQQIKDRLQLQRAVRQKSLLPRLQAWAVVAVMCLAASALMLIRREHVSAELFIFCVTWMACGVWCMRMLMARLQKNLWMLHWIEFCGLLSAQLSWGRTLGTVLGEFLVSPSALKLHSNVRSSLQNALQDIRAGEAIQSQSSKSKERFVKAFKEQFAILVQLYNKNCSLLEACQALAEESRERLLQELNAQAESLNLWLLLPMFVFFVPAFLLLMLGPLLFGMSL